MTSTRRIGWLLGLMAVLGGIAAWRVLHVETVTPDVDPYADRFQADSDRLAQARAASLIERPPSGAADWPQWLGPTRDGVAGTVPPLQPWPPGGPRRVWSVPGGPGHSGLAIAGNRVYTLFQDGDEETVVCLDAVTGKPLWRRRSKARFEESSAGLGPHATPTVADGRVYTVGATGQFQCLDAATGDAVWSVDLVHELGGSVPTYGVSPSPLVDGDRVIVILGPVAAFDRGTGKLLWKSGSDRPGHSSPILATLAGRRQLLAMTGQSLLGIDPDGGALLWTYPWATRGDYNIATPLVAGDYVYVSSGYGKGCGLIEIARDASGSLSARAVYEHNRMRNVFSTSVLHRGALYGFDETLLACMDLRSGAIRWKQRGFEKGSVVRVGDRLVVLGETGRLALVEASPDAYRELSSCEISKTRCWAPLSPALGKLFVRDQETISCFDLEPPR